jgi:hypothetical protein
MAFHLRSPGITLDALLTQFKGSSSDPIKLVLFCASVMIEASCLAWLGVPRARVCIAHLLNLHDRFGLNGVSKTLLFYR